MTAKRIVAAIALIGLLVGAGCAKMQNSIAANGGFFTSTKADYIVRNDSGGKIMDVWVLRNVIVQSEEHSDGWLFLDQNGNPVHLGGDVKVIRVVNHPELLEQYHEYHSEFETKSYQELYEK